MKDPNIKNEESLYPNFGLLQLKQRITKMNFLCEQIKLKLNLRLVIKPIKPKGYQFPCTIVSVFTTKKGNIRVVGEMDDYGLLHIFNEDQLEHRLIPPAEYHK